MNTQDRWFAGKRMFLALGIGLFLVAAWQGGQTPAADFSSPMGMMARSDTMPGASGVRGMMQSGMRQGRMMARGMIQKMQSMHRQMMSQMPMTDGRRSMHGSGMGPGMMSGMMGEGMGPMHGEGTETTGEADEEAFEGLALDVETEQWLRSARGFDTVADRTGEAEVVVGVGADDGLQYGPVAIRVDPGTTIRWRWTGQGGLHDVAFIDEDGQSPLQGDRGAEFTRTFDAPGEYRYECTPHTGLGMRGVVIVAESE